MSTNRNTRASSRESQENATIPPSGSAGNEWLDEAPDDDDDLEYEPSTEEESDDGLHEFFEQLIEDEEGCDDEDEEEFHGQQNDLWLCSLSLMLLYFNRCGRRLFYNRSAD